MPGQELQPLPWGATEKFSVMVRFVFSKDRLGFRGETLEQVQMPSRALMLLPVYLLSPYHRPSHSQLLPTSAPLGESSHWPLLVSGKLFSFI